MSLELPVSHANNFPGGCRDLRRMGGHEDRDAGFAAQLGEQRAARAAPFSESRLPVGSSAMTQRRFVHERSRNRGTLHLPARHLLRIVPQPMADADTLGQTRGSRIGVASVHSGEQTRQRDVVADGECRQQVEELKYEPDTIPPDACQLIVAQRRQRTTFEVDVSARRPVHRAAQVEQCRLSASRRPHEGDEIAGVELPMSRRRAR